MELTRALLEHYLRATGWTIGERRWWVRGSFEIGTFPDMVLAEIATQIDRIARAERIFASALAFRLGLCAAAEDGLAAAAVLTRSGRTAEVIVLAAQADRLLRKAGVDPAAWERARQP